VGVVYGEGSTRLIAIVGVNFLRFVLIAGVSLQSANIFALVAAAMCTVRNLERVSSPRMANNGTADIRRRKMFDFLWCGIFPFIFSAMRMLLFLLEMIDLDS